MIVPGTIRALLLDLDGTLLDDTTVDAGVVAACFAVAARVNVTADRLVEANHAIWPGLWAELGGAWMRGGMTGREVGLEAWRRTMREVDVDDEELINLAADTHETFDVEALRLYDDVAPLLTWARADGHRLAIVTNGASDTQRTKLHELKLEKLADSIAISGELGLVKPEPGIFEYALRELGVAAESAVMVGDSLENDVAGARASGITSIWLNRLGVPLPDGDQPDHVITSLAELPALLG